MRASLRQDELMLSNSQRTIPDDTPDSLAPRSNSTGASLATDDGRASGETPDVKSSQIANMA